MAIERPAGILTHGLLSLPPPSIRQTVLSGFSLKRLANTHPAEPAPMII
jgi:hypothetical protein